MPSTEFGAGIVSTTGAKKNFAFDRRIDEADFYVDSTASEEATLKIVTDFEEIRTVLDGAGKADAVFESGFSLGLDASYSEEFIQSRYSVTFLACVKVVTQYKRIRLDPSYHPDVARLLESNPTNFARDYGDMYCRAKQYGGILFVIGSYFTGSEEYTKIIKGELRILSTQFGAWGDVEQKFYNFGDHKKFTIHTRTTGNAFNIPDGTLLETPGLFTGAVAKWMDGARGDKQSQIGEYFQKYPEFNGHTAPPADLDNYRALKDQLNKAKGYQREVTEIRCHRESFDLITNPALDAEEKKVGDFQKSCQRALDALIDDPFTAKQVPAEPALSLPAQNPFSVQQVTEHLKSDLPVVVTLDRNVSTGRHTLLGGKPYVVKFEYGDNDWYCFPPQDQVDGPPNIVSHAGLYTNDPNGGTLFLWGEQFRFDHRSAVTHKSGAKGSLKLIYEIPK